MSDENIESTTEKLQWETPVLESLGEIGDVASGAGLNVEGGLAGS